MFKLVCVVRERDTKSRSFAYSLFFHGCHWFLKEMGLVWKLPRSTHELFDADLGCDIGMRGGIFYE